MKFILLNIIRLYWFIIPEYKRRSCLFEESCSRHVFRISKEDGFRPGIKAFYSRFRKCRPGYKVGYNSLEGTIELHLVDGTVLKEADISDMFKTK